MAEGTVVEVITYLGRALRRRGLRIEKLILFGSHAKGQADRESDIDIAVVSPDFEGKDIFERVELTGDAEADTIRKFVVPLDVVMLTPSEYESATSPVAAFAREGKAISHWAT